MKPFSSIVTLLLASAAAASDAHDIMAQPRIARIVNAVEKAEPGADVPCMAEVKAVFECLGEPCINCFMEIFKDINESTTCESLAADKEFCPAIKGCITDCGENDCTDSAKKLEECAEKNYPDAAGGGENPCPDLCKEEEDGSSKVPAPTDASSFVKTGNDAYDIVAQPRIVKIVNNVQNAEHEADIPCATEVLELFECLGGECILCFVGIVEDFDEDTTCESLMDDETFCADIEGCVVQCGDNDCTASAEKLEECAEQNYPDATDDACPGLCEESEEDDAPPETYKIA